MDVKNTIVMFNVEVCRDDLARRGVKPPEDWRAVDLYQADRLGLLRAYAVDVLDPGDV